MQGMDLIFNNHYPFCIPHDPCFLSAISALLVTVYQIVDCLRLFARLFRLRAKRKLIRL